MAPTPAAIGAPGLSPRPSELYIDCTAANSKAIPSPKQIIAELYRTAVRSPPTSFEPAANYGWRTDMIKLVHTSDWIRCMPRSPPTEFAVTTEFHVLPLTLKIMKTGTKKSRLLRQ